MILLSKLEAGAGPTVETGEVMVTIKSRAQAIAESQSSAVIASLQVQGQPVRRPQAVAQEDRHPLNLGVDRDKAVEKEDTGADRRAVRREASELGGGREVGRASL